MESPIRIHMTQLKQLERGIEPNLVPGFRYLGSYGIKFKRYHEIALQIFHPFAVEVDANNWSTTPLKFKIGTQQIEVGPMTRTMVLFTEAIYADSTFGHDRFDLYATIKMLVNENEDYQQLFCKSLFYLNAYYMTSIGSKAALVNLKCDFDWFCENVDPAKVDLMQPATRKRNISRKDFIFTEPLNLFTEAVNSSGTQKFLLFYRVLEFFMKRSYIAQVNELRNNIDISDEDLIKTLQIRNEEDLLDNLVSKFLRNGFVKKKVYQETFGTGLIKQEKSKALCRALYAYRNSIVHAKEDEMVQTKFPNPFQQDTELNHWTEVVELLAQKCIQSYNTVK